MKTIWKVITNFCGINFVCELAFFGILSFFIGILEVQAKKKTNLVYYA